MKKIFLLLSLALPLPALAFKSVVLDTAVSNLTTSYGANFPNWIMSELPAGIKGLLVHNGTSSRVAMHCYPSLPGGKKVPSAQGGSPGRELFILANSTVTLNDFSPNSDCFLRSDSGSTISSGKIDIQFGTGGRR